MNENKIELVCITDTHLNKDNFEQNKTVFNEAANIAIENSHFNIYHLGDVFDSREAQSLKELGYFDDILTSLHEKGVNLIVIPGNHDKMSYTSEQSYLDVYRHHPNIKVVRSGDLVTETISGICVWMIPYFKENGCYQSYLEKVSSSIDDSSFNILLTHCAVESVRNNDGSQMGKGNSVGLKQFGIFDKVYTGHYHDYQEIGDNIEYIGSSIQHNFGEERKKGVTLIYTDGAIKTIKTKAKGYIRKDFEIGKTKIDTILKSFSLFKNDYKKVRLIGSKEECDSFDKSKFIEAGIKIEKKSSKNVNSKEKAKKFTVHTVSSIKSSFPKFVKDKNITKEKMKIGKKYIDKL